MKFKVTIDYRKGPSFSMEVQADTANKAEIEAAAFALASGFKSFPKKFTTHKMEGRMPNPLEIPKFLEDPIAFPAQAKPRGVNRAEATALRRVSDEADCAMILAALSKQSLSYKDLSEKLGLSIALVGRAMRTLKNRGDIEVFSQRGFAVPAMYHAASQGSRATGTIYNKLSERSEALEKSMGRHLPEQTDLHMAFYGGGK